MTASRQVQLEVCDRSWLSDPLGRVRSVKFLHTSDWHVGRTIRGRSRADEHRAVLAEIVEIAHAELVDVVLVVGDLFDTAAPTAESEKIVFQALLNLAATGATVVVLAGNHDNARRLQAVEPLLELGRVVTRPVFVGADDGGVVELISLDGSERAKVAVLPFLSQRHVVKAADLMELDAADHGHIYDSHVHGLLEGLCSGFTEETINLVAAHLTVSGGRLGGGERAAHTVFDYEVRAASFPAMAQYVALGHLHRRQQVPGGGQIHYCGSPLQLDFGETKDIKSVSVVEAHAGAAVTVRDIELLQGRRLQSLVGTLDELRELAGEAEGAWLKVIVHEAPRVGLADEVRALFPGAVDVVVERPEAECAAGAQGPERLSRAGRGPAELFGGFLAERGIEDPALVALFAEVLNEIEGVSS